MPNCSLTWQLGFDKKLNSSHATTNETGTWGASPSGSGLSDAITSAFTNVVYQLSPPIFTTNDVALPIEVGNIVTMAVPAPPAGLTAGDITEIGWLVTGEIDWAGAILSALNCIPGYAAGGYSPAQLQAIFYSGGGASVPGPGWSGALCKFWPAGEDPLTSGKWVGEAWHQASSSADVDPSDGHEYYVYRTKWKFGDPLYGLDFTAPDSHVFRPIAQQVPTSATGPAHNSGVDFGTWLIGVLGSTVNLRCGVEISPGLGCLFLNPSFGVPIEYSGTTQIVASCSGLFLTIDIIYNNDDTPVGTGMSNPWNLQDKQGRYHRVGVNSGIQYLRSDSTVPKPGWAVTSQVTTNGADANPRQVLDERNRIHVLWERSPNVLEAVSDDDGQTWGTPNTMIPGGKHPTIAIGHDGSILRAAYVSGVLKGTYQAQGDTAASAPFTFQKWNGSALVDISVADDTFHIQQGHEGPARWLLASIESGDTDTSDWWSGDDGRTWTKIT